MAINITSRMSSKRLPSASFDVCENDHGSSQIRLFEFSNDCAFCDHILLCANGFSLHLYIIIVVLSRIAVLPRLSYFHHLPSGLTLNGHWVFLAGSQFCCVTLCTTVSVCIFHM